jgi:RNA polymerase sigma-70 factor, ECF subfamily
LKPEIQRTKQLLLEEEVIKQSQKEPKAFRPLYEKYFKPIYVFVLHRVGSKELAGDITSQVFLKALLKLHQYQFRGLPFSSWLFRIAVNECNDFFRKHKRERMVVLDEKHAEVLYEEMFGSDHMEELKTKLPLILERLSPDELMFIELRFMDARPFAEISEILGITENYAKVKTYRVLDKMKKLFLGK